jgi:hypothetical protein
MLHGQARGIFILQLCLFGSGQRESPRGKPVASARVLQVALQNGVGRAAQRRISPSGWGVKN